MDDEALRARLHAVFVEELEEHLERLEHGLGVAAQDPESLHEGLVDDLFRAAHSLKGAAAAVGATEISSLCHQLEDTLAGLRQGEVDLSSELVSDMVRLVDRVAQAGAALRPAADRPDGGDPSIAGADEARTEPVGKPARVAQEPARSGRDTATVRLAGSRVDALLSGAGELITASYRSEVLVAGCRTASARLAEEADRWRRDRAAAHRVLAPLLNEHPSVREVLDRVDLEWRRLAGELDSLARTGAAHQTALRGLATGFAESVRQARMVPFTEATSGLARAVRDVCAEHGKQAVLVVEAADVEVDKQLVATLHDVLGHAVRNAVVHGIERPEQRTAAGKPAAGTVTVSATLGSAGILVTVADDGGGIDVARVQERAAALGLGPNRDGRMDLTEALFHPGLTTADEVTEASGRGVGLDAVRAAVDAAGGSVSFDSSPGEGSELSIQVPLTLSTLRVVLVRVAGELVALPTSAVGRVVRLPVERTRLAGRDVMEVDDAAVPIVPLARVLGWGDGQAADSDPTGLFVAVPDGSVVLVGDELVAEREVVLRAASPRLSGLNLLLGTTQTEDGSVCLVLSPSVCARAALSGAHDAAEVASEEEQGPPRVLLVEDTVTTRELERSVLLDAGYDVVVAVDGQQAWEMLQSREFDIVVSDVNMPRMDGIALCRMIRGSRRHVELPVVLVTSLHSDNDRRRGVEAGADAYLTKQGFDRAELVATLERLL